MTGKIIKGIAGFYYVNTEDNSVYECKAKGIFRNRSMTPLVGDDVMLDILDENAKKANIVEILERKNVLVRPAVSNVDQALVIFAAAEPNPNLNLLDRFLVMMQKQSVETVICFNKKDKVADDALMELYKIYQDCGSRLLFASALHEEGIEDVLEVLRGKTTVLAGPSGVGKSSLMNIVKPEANMETGELSVKLMRGKHTTRHSELICIGKSTFLMDTPGFSSFYVNDMEKEELRDYFPEFVPYASECRFLGCMHMKEPDCGVKRALEQGLISSSRYENYMLMYEELRKQKKY